MTNDIRKFNQVTEFLDLAKKDISKLNQLATNVRPRSCKICRSDKIFKYIELNGYELYLCPDCEFLAIYDEVNLDKFFEESISLTKYTDNVLKESDARKSKIFRPLANRIKNMSPDANKILEIGCGGGLLLEELASCFPNSEILGIESHKESCSLGINRGNKIINTKFEEYNQEGEFDVVVFWAVLDHIENPIKFFSKCSQLLSPGGLLIFGNANYMGLEIQIMGKDSNIFTLPHRRSFFTPKTFTKILEETGFSNREILGTGQLDLFYIEEFLKVSNDYIVEAPLLRTIFNSESLKAHFTEFLQQNLLVSHLTISARKVI
jgi:SAM-dependent methyltransferase